MAEVFSSENSFMASLMCSEVLQSSPSWSSSSGFATNPSDGSSDSYRPRTVPIDGEVEIYGDRTLNRKLTEQQISLNVASWNILDERQEYWFRAFQWYREKKLSLASIQMAISFVDRFMSNAAKSEDCTANEIPLDCIFEAALVIVEQLLDDDPDLDNILPAFTGNVGRARSPKAVADIQIAVKLMLQTTQWEVIDWTPASFIPHYLEEAHLRQSVDSPFQQQILAVATLFMMDSGVASNVPPSAIAALAVILQSYLVVDCFFRENANVNSDISDPATFLHRTVLVVLGVGNMTMEYFNDMTDFALTRLVASSWHDGFDTTAAARFCGIWKATFGQSLNMLESSIGVENMTPVEAATDLYNSFVDVQEVVIEL